MENKSNGKKSAEGRRGKFKKLLNRYGIAVALFACAAIVAGTWLFTDGNIIGVKPSATPAPTAPLGTSSVQSDSQIAQNLEQAMQSLNSATPAPTATPAATSKLMPDLTKPVKGNITKKFAYDTLVYMKTLNQWSTHPGVDIAGKVGDDVVAALKGTVDSVYKDPLLGNCVKIKCANDIVMVYAGLLKSGSVKKGDAVEAGELIGQIGNTAASESTEDPHLHFEVWVKSAPANPEPFFKK
jgi:murein DD-endopeptidase MepM/ murein hydrolase activator NlpD